MHLKKKLNRLFLLAAMGLGLIACTENDLVEGGDSNGAQNEGTTYVGFTIDFSKTRTRATTETGTNAEQKINTAYVLMTDANDKIEKVLSFTGGEDKGVTEGEGYYVNKGKFLFKTSAGVHHFYAVVNPETAPTTENLTINNYFKTAVALNVDDIASVTDEENGSFMMASEDVLIASVEDGVTEEEALDGSNNSYTINVERATAKVTMTCDNTTLTNATNNAGGTLNKTQFTLKQGAGVSFRMAQASIIADDDNTFKYTSSPTSVYIKGTDPSEEKDNIHRSAAPVYCLENIRGSYKQGNTTYLTLQTTFTPANVVDCADEVKPLTTNKQAPGSTFYVVKQGVLAGNYLMGADLQSYRDSKNDQSALPAGVEAISDAYTDGNCYFGPIWIGQTDADKENAPVVRNTWYNLKITGITLSRVNHKLIRNNLLLQQLTWLSHCLSCLGILSIVLLNFNNP